MPNSVFLNRQIIRNSQTAYLEGDDFPIAVSGAIP
jgi:hypothetical protein